MPNGTYISEPIKVSLQTMRGTEAFIYTDLMGQFLFEGLPPGDYTVEVEADRERRFEITTERVFVPRAMTAFVTISLKEKKVPGTQSKAAPGVVSARGSNEKAPASAVKEFNRAQQAGADGKTTDAITHLRKAIAIYPGYLMAHNDLGTYLLSAGKLDEASEEFRRAIEIDPATFNPQLNLGVVLVQQHQFSEAATTLEKALSLDASSPAAHLYAGLAFMGLNDLSRAEKELRASYELGGTKFSLALFHLGQAAQATTGNLTGTVKDQAGGAVAGAKVTAKNQDTGETFGPFTSSGEGVYRITNLKPGKYTVTIEGTGFKRSNVTDVDVKLGTDNPLDPVLEPGQVSEEVTVVAGGEELAQVTSQISSSFETRKVQDLPSNSAGGGIDTLALLAPGVVPGFGNVNSNGTTLSVNGNRARSNNFTLDGTDNNDLTIGGPNFFVDNQDAVAEFQVITNNYSAQYGRNQGAVINIVTKGGGNEFHGSGFEFHRNSSALDAMTNAERADPSRSKRDKFISNVFGGTFGGPIVKNKAFFFVDGQLIRQRQQFNFQAGNPAITRAGLATLATAFPGNPAIAVLINQSVFALQPNAIAQATAPTGTLCFPRDPTLACTGANAVVVPTAFPQYPLALPFDQKEYGLRGDFNPTSKDSFNIKYRYQQSPETGTLGLSNGFGGSIPFSSRNLNGAYTRQIGSRAVNEAKVAWQKLSVIFGGACTGPLADPLKGCIPDAADIDKAFTNLSFSGIRDTTGTTLQGIGPATNLPQGRQVRVFQASDNFSITMGRHSLIMGVDYRNLDNGVPFLPFINGQFRFSSTARLVANSPDFVTLAAGEPRINYKENDQFYYVQDDFKVRENLTLNLGVRYEFTGQPINTLNKITVERESDPARALWRQSIPIEQRTVPFIPADKNNFAPRVGFAYSPRWGNGGFSRMLFGENDATVIRGGYSIAYDPAFYNLLLNVSTSTPTVFNNTINNTGTLTAPLFRLPANPTGDVVRSALGAFIQRNTFDPKFFNQTRVGQDFHSPYSQQYSFGIQRQFNRNNVAEIRYVGNHGVGLFQSINRNPFVGSNIRRTSGSLAGTFSNGGIANGFTSAGFGSTVFNFPAFPNLLPPGVAPLTCIDNTATPDNEGVCNGRILQQGQLRTRENTGSSTYNSMQTRYNGRLFNQFTVGASYTWSKTLDNASEVFSFGEGAFAQNPFNINAGEKGLSGNDRRHAGSLNFIWDIPHFKEQKGFVLRPFAGSRHAPRNTVGISDIDVSFYGFAGFTPSPTGFYSLNELNTTGNLVPVTPNDVRLIFNGPGAALKFGTPYGTVGRNSERGPALNQMNIGFFKNTNITERVKVQFRAELFNALNHPNPGYGVAFGSTLPDTVVEDAGAFGGAGSFVGFNDRQAMELSSRRVQFGLRITF
ncbi:MAG: carboxypeptidase regulatory-like domain-containing protein [Acidobacteria bacterium]|nr:carboxypeptidase regulatory-like domain-containing protein [Acidobacteriota bacterium]